MRVVLVSSSFLPSVGGLQLMVRQLALGLQANAVDVVVMVTAGPGAAPRPHLVDGIPVQWLWRCRQVGALWRPARGILGAVRVCARVGALLIRLGRWRPDLVHAHFLSEGAFCAALAAAVLRIPFVVTIHGSDMGAAHLARTHSRMMMRSALALSRRVTAVSTPLLESLCAAFPASIRKAVVIGNGVDLSFFDRVTASAGSEGQRYILSVGNLVGAKGHDVLLEAFGRLPAAATAPRLLIAGDGPERAKLEARMARLCLNDRVSLLGIVTSERIAALMHGCEFVVVPSRSEGFGLVVLEAWACRRAVIATAVGGLGELIEHGVNGLLVPPEEVESLVTTMGYLLRNPAVASAMGAMGRREAETRDWSGAVSAYLRLYRDCCPALPLVGHPT